MRRSPPLDQEVTIAAARRTGAVSAAVLVLGLVTTGSAEAVCVAPAVSVAPASALPGTSVAVEGARFVAECRDHGEPEPSPPSTGIELLFEQAGQSQVLAVVDADAQYAFRTTVTVPATASPGAATVVARHGGGRRDTAPFTVEGAAPAAPPKVPARQPAHQLPRTGPLTGELAATGAGLVLLGAAALHAGTRGRRRTGAPAR